MADARVFGRALSDLNGVGKKVELAEIGVDENVEHAIGNVHKRGEPVVGSEKGHVEGDHVESREVKPEAAAVEIQVKGRLGMGDEGAEKIAELAEVAVLELVGRFVEGGADADSGELKKVGSVAYDVGAAHVDTATPAGADEGGGGGDVRRETEAGGDVVAGAGGDDDEGGARVREGVGGEVDGAVAAADDEVGKVALDGAGGDEGDARFGMDAVDVRLNGELAEGRDEGIQLVARGRGVSSGGVEDDAGGHGAAANDLWRHVGQGPDILRSRGRVRMRGTGLGPGLDGGVICCLRRGGFGLRAYSVPREKTRGGEMMTKEELKGYGLFAELDERELEAAACIASEETVEAGAPLFEEGKAAEKLFLLLTGSVDLHFRLEEHKHGSEPVHQHKVLAGEISAGMPFGISALIEPHVYQMTARAATRCKVLMLDGAVLRALMGLDARMGYALMKEIARASSERLHLARLELARDYETEPVL